MKKITALSIILLIIFCSNEKKREKLIGEWEIADSRFYNVATKEERTWLPPDISGSITFDDKGWSINVRRSDGFIVKGGGVYRIRSNRVILKFYMGLSWTSILENDTLILDVKPTLPIDPDGFVLRFYKK